MKVLRILSDVRLVIAELEVHLGKDVRNSPTLCAIVTGAAGAPDQVVPLSTPDGRPIFMKIDNAITSQQIGEHPNSCGLPTSSIQGHVIR